MTSKKLKITFHGHKLLVIVTVTNLIEGFTEKNCKKKNKSVFSNGSKSLSKNSLDCPIL